ncbi:MAG: hypothetical protein AUF79_03035 [Crenarchaeota archaeon 13_1_20CM_2_51_8]|nr:MAG: hypothetical protein AUF79_03035 [Crenarchaeota archaeon 13_1_20CM_2_51_8]
MGSEFWTNTPTVRVEPAVKGPIVGPPLGQLVAEVDVVIQTRPVAGLPWAEGTEGGTKRSAMIRTSGSTSTRRLFNE